MTIKEFEIQLALGSLSYNDKVNLARNLRTSKKILTILSKDKNWYVRCDTANNPNTPIEILTKLSKDKDWWVRCRVASNLNTPKKVLIKLATNGKEPISYCAIKNLSKRKS